nr:PREDICTED: protein DOWNY MILDEW RESISTANCE 6 [Daucus carota subsp. sativus]
MEAKVISSGQTYTTLPPSFIRPASDRPDLSQVSDCENVPLIDLAAPDKHLIIRQIGDACQQYGFFQVINHGVAAETMERMQRVAKEFFELPVEEKMKLYSDDPTKTMRLSTSFNVKKETINNWRDYLRLHCYPLDRYSEEWPSNPPSFK